MKDKKGLNQDKINLKSLKEQLRSIPKLKVPMTLRAKHRFEKVQSIILSIGWGYGVFPQAQRRQ